MPRYDDRYSSNDRYSSSTRLYVGHLSSRTRERDLERLFSKYGRFLDLEVYVVKMATISNLVFCSAVDGGGSIITLATPVALVKSRMMALLFLANHFRRIRDLDMKRDYAFIEFSDPRDADDARYRLDGRDFDGSRITVELARGTPRGSREISSSRGGPPPGSGRCFNCGLDGHWARDCSAGDWKNKCYRCGDRGHIERNCKNSPKKLRRGESYSRSPVRSRSRSPRRKRRSPSRSYSRGRSYSRSRSPVRKEKDQSPEAARSRSPEPMVDNSPPSKDRKLSLTPEEGSPMREKNSPKDNGLSPKGNVDGDIGTNEQDRSPSPREDRSPGEDRSPVEDDEQ